MIGQTATLLVIVSIWVPHCHGYPNGPPTEVNPGICMDMMPLHNSTAQTSAAPFEIVVGSDCYNDGINIPVYVHVKEGEETYKYFEGLFVMARTAADGTAGNQGTFTTTDSELSPLTCFSEAGSAIGHNTAEHWTCKTFNWMAPENLTADVTFRGTVVKNKETYWVGIMSSAISYNANCNTTAIPCTTTIATAPATAIPSTTTVAGSEGQHYHMVPMLFSLGLMYVLHYILP